MSDSHQGSIPFKRAVYLALTVLCIYYPITIASNIPLAHWRDVRFLLLPAAVTFAFYAMLILVVDRVIGMSEKMFGPRMLELRPATIMLSISVSVFAIFLSQMLFKIGFSAARTILETMGKDTFYSLGPPSFWTNLRRVNVGLTLVISISIFYLILNRRSHLRIRSMEIQAEQLKKENILAQYQALKNQISPHFLFNSLSILSSLVHVDANLSEQFIEQLAKVYRYILDQKDNETVSLKTELDFLRSYAFLLKIRFEHKLEVKVLISDQQAERCSVAPLTLQLLVENCVKHNRMSESEPLLITISIDERYLLVANKVAPRAEGHSNSSTAIGLTNIQKRYELLTNMPVQIVKNDGFFAVKIPLL